MIKKIDTRIKNGDQDGELHIHYRFIPNKKTPLVVFASGFSVDGTESHRMFLNVADAYNKLGYATILFDYKGCGYSDGDFRDFNITSAKSDLQAVYDWAINNLDIDKSKIVIHAQSLGTAISTLTFSQKNIKNYFVYWNLSANLYERYIKILGNEILSKNEICLTSKGLYVKNDFLKNLKKYDILEEFKYFNHPVLFLNSGSDTVGDATLSEKAFLLNKNPLSKRLMVDGANHSFKCQESLEKIAIDKTIEWLNSVFEYSNKRNNTK